MLACWIYSTFPAGVNVRVKALKLRHFDSIGLVNIRNIVRNCVVSRWASRVLFLPIVNFGYISANPDGSAVVAGQGLPTQDPGVFGRRRDLPT